jgi:hypothetical protein
MDSMRPAIFTFMNRKPCLALEQVGFFPIAFFLPVVIGLSMSSLLGLAAE